MRLSVLLRSRSEHSDPRRGAQAMIDRAIAARRALSSPGWALPAVLPGPSASASTTAPSAAAEAASAARRGGEGTT